MTLRTTLRRLAAWLPALLSPLAPAACPPGAPPPSAAQLAAAERQDRGFLWAIDRDGRRSYLYGTLHVGRPEWMRSGPRVSAALSATDVLALEIDPTDPGVQAELANGDGAPPLAVPAAMKSRLKRQVAAACLPDAAFASMGPAMQAVMLGVLEARWAGLDPGYAQEQALARRAREDGHEVVALESVALQKKVLVSDSPAEMLAMIDGLLAQLEGGSGRRQISRLARAWEHSDLATLEGYERWCDCARTADERAALRSLNDERNPGLADGIEALHRDGKSVFAAVGALHMTGPQSLPRLLAARGFRVERIALQR